MADISRSGAFLQQCFAVHPLCLSLKRMDPENRLVVPCRSCKLVHYVAVSDIFSPPSGHAASGDAASHRARLLHCLERHPLSVTIRAMDVTEDALGLRCAECRYLMDIAVAAFETHHPPA
jgi:hypothetical protein